MSVTATPPAPIGATTPPPVTGWPRQLRWTVALFHAVNSTGVFAGRRPMLIRGVLLEQGPMNDPHADAIEIATGVLHGVFGAGWRVRAQLPLRLGQDTDPVPDFAILMGGSRDGAPTTAALVIEVSDTTLTFDVTTKTEVYATASIPEYWVLDVNARCLHVFRSRITSVRPRTRRTSRSARPTPFRRSRHRTARFALPICSPEFKRCLMPATTALPTPTGPTTPPPASVGPRPWKWTREQYFQMAELGYFGDRRVQLIFGEVVEMPKQNWPHVVGCRKTADQLRAVFVGVGWVSEQSPLPFRDSAPEPDAWVVPGRMEDYTDHPTTALLVVEVSDTTLAHDLSTKAELYATANIPEYWVLDLNARCLHVYRDPVALPAALGATAYQTHLTLGPTDTVSPLAAPNSAVCVADLLP